MEEPKTVTLGNTGGGSPTESTAQVHQSATELVEKHRKQRADKGKPRGPRKDDSQTPIPLAPTDPIYQLNIELVKKSVTALVGTCDAIVCRRIYNKSLGLGCDENLAKEYALTAGLSKDEAQIISECTASIMARSEFLVRHAPEVMLGCVVISYGVRITTTMHRLDELEKLQKSKLKKGESEPSSQLK